MGRLVTRYALISDIHGNLPALEAALASNAALAASAFSVTWWATRSADAFLAEMARRERLEAGDVLCFGHARRRRSDPLVHETIGRPSASVPKRR